MLRAGHPFVEGQQPRVFVAGRGRVSGLGGPVGQGGAGDKRAGVLGAQELFPDRNSAAYWSRAVAGSPAIPVQ